MALDYAAATADVVRSRHHDTFAVPRELR